MTALTRTVFLCLLLLLAVPVAQSAQPAPEPPNIWKTITDEQNIALAAYVLANVADAGTDWTWTFQGRTYHVSAVRRCSFVGGTLGGALAISHYFPRYRKLVTAGLVVGSAILAGRAYGHTLTRGPTPALPLAERGMVFAVRLR